MNAIREAWAVGLAELRSTIVSIRALFLVTMYGFVGGGLGLFLLWVDEETGGKLKSLSSAAAALDDAQRQEILLQFPEVLRDSLGQTLLYGGLPPLPFVVLFGSTVFVPLLSVFVGYNRIADDLSIRYTRFIFQRIRRGSYLAGKIGGVFVFSTAAILLVQVLLVCLGVLGDHFEAERMMDALPGVWFSIALLVLAYVAYVSFFSVISPTPFLALLFSVMGLAVIRTATALVPALRTIWIGHWDLQLWVLDGTAVMVYLATAAVFSFLAFGALIKRDV